MQEVVVNLHMHTRYSDGAGSHRDIALAALKSGIDVVIITDHNVRVQGIDQYVRDGRRRVLVLAGEEVHDRARLPQKDHMLILGASQELAPLGDNPAALIKSAAKAGGYSFLAHVHDPAAPAFGESDISWENWSIAEYTGLELWNGLSELKAHVPTRLHGIFYAFFPAFLPHGPAPAAILRWDRLLGERRVVAIAGSDAHALRMRMGPLKRTVFPYAYHFSTVNTHVLLRGNLTGNVGSDRGVVHGALAAGNCFIGCDLPAPTRGFRFTAHGPQSEAIMGDEISGRGGVVLQTRLPSYAELALMRDGRVAHRAAHAQALTYMATEPGVYRVEAHRRYLGRRRGWIFSNPIYVR